MTLINYIWGIIIHPGNTLQNFILDKHRLLYSFISVVIFAFCYSVGSLIGYLQGNIPYGWELLLNIPIEKFFLWQSVYLIPITITTWVCLSGFVQLFGKLFGGKGNFEDTLALLGLPFIVLLPGMFIPDMIIENFLSKEIVRNFVFWNIINPVRLIVGSLWVISIHVLAVRRAQELFLGKAILVTLLAYIPYIILVITYIH
jgi:hypothetical protein